jgi:hypothetical protein
VYFEDGSGLITVRDGTHPEAARLPEHLVKAGLAE